MSASGMPATEVDLRNTAWANVIHSYGTFAVFSERVRRLNIRRRLRDFFGIALPVVVGFFYANVIGAYQKYLLYVLGLFALAQLLVVIWSLVSKWDDDYAYAANATRENETMSQEWERVAKSSANDIKSYFEITQKQDDKIQEGDRAQNITQKERRFGMRSALLYRRKACDICKLVPKDMYPTNCSCCGNF